MATLKQAQHKQTAWYRGRQAKTGNSLGLRFDKALFKSHPEFSGEVRAHVIAPGRMLIVAEPVAKSRRREDDPVMEAFLSFLAADMAASPQQIKPLERALAERINALVGHLPADPYEDLGDDPLV
jgi:antitoxin PrlF